MKISIITVSYNAELTLAETVNSLITQSYKKIEYIVIDGDSKDLTLQIIKKNKNYIKKYISEQDTGIYDAMNKGLKLASGDIVGFLNSDDIFYDNEVVSDILKEFRENPNIDIVYGNIVYVKKNNLSEIIGKHFPNHRFYFFGESKFTVEANKLADKYSNVVNFGPFMNPQDLSQIYDKIDIVVATYENQNLNERILEPNKFYETLFFEKIIVVSPETLLESKINETGCGFICNSYSEKSIINFIQSLSEIKINTVLNNIRKLNKSDLIEQDSNIFFKKLFFNEMRS